MKALLFLGLFLLTTPSGFAELTKPSGHQSIRWRDTSAPKKNSPCIAVEEDFRQHLLKIVETTTEATKKIKTVPAPAARDDLKPAGSFGRHISRA